MFLKNYESYLLSNFAPLYHYTDMKSFINILITNKIEKTRMEHPFKGSKIKMVSLSRLKNLDLGYLKPFLDIVIELDKNKLNKKYKIIPYDFFICSRKEIYPKSNLKRKEHFEYEEIIIDDIDNILGYIISVDFRNGSIFDRDINDILDILEKNNIKIYTDGKEY